MLREFTIGLLSGDIIARDSYKDSNGDGFVVRYLGELAEDLDENTLQKLEEIQELIDINDCDEQYIQYFEDLQGDIKNFNLTEAERRKFIKLIPSIYSVKGTKKSIYAVAAIKGYEIITYLKTFRPEVAFDNPDTEYDTEGVNYDEGCVTCADLVLEVESLTGVPWSDQEEATLRELIELVLPVNVNLTLTAILPAPINLMAVVANDEENLLTWDDNQPISVGYTIEIQKAEIDSEVWEDLDEVGPGVETYDDIEI